MIKNLIKKKIDQVMDGCASWLNRKEERYSPIKKKIGVILFCILSGSISLYIIVSPMLGNPAPQSRFIFHRPIFLKPIQGHSSNHIPGHLPGLIPGFMPSHIGKSDPPTDHPVISKQLYERIEAFKNNDSLMKADPQLLDSILAFEQLYQSQIKK